MKTFSWAIDSGDLELISEFDSSSGSNEFELHTFAQDKATGEIWFAEDSGCSCPSPYESTFFPQDCERVDSLGKLLDIEKSISEDRIYGGNSAEWRDCISKVRDRMRNKVAV